MQKIISSLRAASAHLRRALERGEISNPAACAARGVHHHAEFALHAYDTAKAEGKDLESAAKDALEFITQLRESTAMEAGDLLSNNAGEDVEAALAQALGVPLAETDAGVQLRREASHQTKGACGDIEYYFDDKIQEIGFIAFPGTEHERVVRHIRHWDHATLDAHNIVSVRHARRHDTFNECLDLLNRAVNTAELSQDSLEDSTRQLLADVVEWMRGLPANKVLEACRRA